MFENIFLDLDGTIIDSKEGIVNSVIYSLKNFNIEVKNREELEKFIGPPLNESFKEFYNFNEKQTELAIKLFRERYETTGLWEAKLYPGIKELINDLKKSGKRVILATSKPEKFAKKILEGFKMDKDFFLIIGATLDGSRSAKKDVIKFALDKIKDINLEECIMIGDRNYDILGAKENNMKSIGVTYGFGTKPELETAGADYIEEDVEELRKILF